MVGVCGVVGEDSDRVEALSSMLRRTGEEDQFDYVDDELRIRVVLHPDADERQPAEIPGRDARVWVWGDLFGVQTPQGYRTREAFADDRGDAAYCALLYDRFGSDCFARLNGEFCAILLDRDAGTLSLVTDRMGTRPVFHCRDESGALLFTTNPQSLADVPGLELAFDPRYATEYLTLRRVLGVRTPLRGVEQLPPASQTTVSLDGESFQVDTYWRPEYDPSEASFPALLESFTARFRAAMRERVDPERRYGVLLSGGSDSRLLLAALADVADDVLAIHANDWWNREAKIAERAARAAGVEFTFLERDPNYRLRALSENPALVPFAGSFYQAHWTGFEEELRDAVDVLLTGNFPGFTTAARVPSYEVPLGFADVSLPVERGGRSIPEYLELLDRDPPWYLRPQTDVTAILASQIEPTDGGVANHGVEYPSVESLVLFSFFWPLTNADYYLNYGSLVQSQSHWTPFLDRRLLEFGPRFPVAYRIRRNVVNRAVKRLSPRLADVPYSNTGVAMGRSFPVHYVGKYLRDFWEQFLSTWTPSSPHFTRGSWPNGRELLQRDEFVREAFEGPADLVRTLPFLDHDGVEEYYRAYLDGAEHGRELYNLATFLRMPVTERIGDDRATAPAPKNSPTNRQ